MVKKTAILLLACTALATAGAVQAADDGWISLFNGEDLSGWKASENEGTFSVEDGMLKVNGKRSHLFYTGPVNGADFKNFEFQADVKTTPKANSGIYFHTTYQQDGWPGKGYECQVNTTHSDRKKTGGLYGVQDVIDNAPSKDGQWFHYYIKVVGKHITIKIDGKTTVNWIEPEGWGRGGRKVDHGTFAIQGHDPGSLIYYKNIEVKPLPDDAVDDWVALFDGTNGLEGWKASENEGTFSVEEGTLKVNGKRSHLFYTGPVNGADFKNFEFQAQVMTTPKANSGIYFHTTYQQDGWPGKGYECQVNTTHSDRKKTGGLYGVQDVIDNAPSKDGQWFHYYIKVVGKHITIKIDGQTTVNWIEPEGWERGGRKVDHGTFAIQGHDPGSLIYYKNIMVKPLPDDATDGWVALFDGLHGLEGWKASENQGTFGVENGELIVHGKRSHLFYTGPVNGANFKDFEFQAQVMTLPKANSGIYFHTAYQQDGWPDKGYECQVNSTHSDRKKTGGLYAVKDVLDNAPSEDGKWFHYYIKVRGKHIVIKIDGQTTVDYIEPDNVAQEGYPRMPGRKVSNGTFAIQGHDPGSVVHYKNIMVKPLPETASDGWISLFDGKTFDGWTVNENKDTFSIVDGAIKVKGPRSHCFYTGPVAGADFKNFEFQADVMTMPSANSGIYFHTEFQAEGWPAKGYECQVNTSHGDPRKTGGLWAVQDVMNDAPSKDKEWFQYYIKVVDKHITIKIDGKTTVDWTEPEGWQPPEGMPGRKISHGTFALQGHDPGSVIYYKNIKVKPLDPVKAVVVTGGHGFERDPFFAMFDSYDNLEYVEAVQKDDSELFEDISDWDYDVIVLYNMTQKISPKRQENFKTLLADRGVGLVALHHCEAAFADWDEFRKIIGAKYPLKDQTIDGTACKTATYKHDVDLKVQIADRNHPITCGLDDFAIHDETYKGVWFARDNHVLITTDHETSDKTIGWARPDYGKARVVFLQGGHDGKAYANPNFRTLVGRAICWSARRL